MPSDNELINNFKQAFSTIFNNYNPGPEFISKFSELLDKWGSVFSEKGIYLEKDILLTPKTPHPHPNKINLTLLHLIISIANVEAVKILVDHPNKHMRIPRNIKHSSTNNALHFVGLYSRNDCSNDAAAIAFNQRLIQIAKILSDTEQEERLEIDLEEAKTADQLHADGGTFAHSIVFGGSLALMQFLITQQKGGITLENIKRVFTMPRKDGLGPLAMARQLGLVSADRFEKYYDAQVKPIPNNKRTCQDNPAQNEDRKRAKSSANIQIPPLISQPPLNVDGVILPPPRVLAGEVNVRIKIEPGTENGGQQGLSPKLTP